MPITKLSIARLSGGIAIIALLAVASPAFAQSTEIRTPNQTTDAGTKTVVLNGTTFANQGLVGAGRLAASTRDFANETLGSFSGMAINLRQWRRNADGSYVGSIFTLPDRGPNDVGPFVGTTDYRNRVHTSAISFNPYTGTTNLAPTTASQNQLSITPTGGFLLTDTTGKPFTGQDSLGNNITRDGIIYPSPTTGTAAGRISLDSEAIAFRADGSFYVSDEYAAGIYYFDANGRQIGAIQTVPAILPRIGGAVNLTGAVAPDTGRRNNQGLEALAITPDGGRLVTILQSATVQDTNGTNQQTRNNTRVLVYDISATPTPTTPVAEYVLQLPIFRDNGNGGAVNRTAAQSEMLALNSNQFLVLSRDGNGRGVGTTNPLVFKSILLIDTSSATNITGTAFETGVTPIATNGTLNSTIKPVQQVELVNMLNPVQLGRFGLNLNSAPSTSTSIGEKWEAMGLAPVLEEAKPQDFFLFVGNDNDFQATNGFINGQPYNASLSGAGGTGENDSVILVYRLTLPTYVDPLALEALKATTPLALGAAEAAGRSIGERSGLAARGWLSAARRSAGGYGTGFRIWAEGDFNALRVTQSNGQRFKPDGFGASGGIDYGFGPARLGVSVGYQELENKSADTFAISAKGTTISGYAGVALPMGLYAEVAGGVTLNLDFDRIDRPAAYGQTASGQTKGEAVNISGEIGYMADFGIGRAGPYGTVDFSRVTLDGYSEAGASLSNATIDSVELESLRYGAGVQISGRPANIVPTLRAGYVWQSDRGSRAATYRLTSAQHQLAQATGIVPNLQRDYAEVEFSVEGGLGHGFSFRAASGARVVGDYVDQRVSIGFGKAF